MSHAYTKIDDEEKGEGNTLRTSMEIESSSDSSHNYTNYGWFTLGFIVIFGIIYAFSGSTPAAPLCPPCSFAECKRSGCDQASSPFVCTNGTSSSGCAAAPNDWYDNPACSSCCDTSQCATTQPSGNDDTIELCPACNNDQCDTIINSCGFSSYMCLEGSAAGGCSQDMYHWPTSTANNICTGCCDGVGC